MLLPINMERAFSYNNLVSLTVSMVQLSNMKKQILDYVPDCPNEYLF